MSSSSLETTNSDSRGLYNAIESRDWDRARSALKTKESSKFVQYSDWAGYNSLHWACHLNAPPDILQSVLDASISAPLQQNYLGQTPLYWAIQKCSDESIAALIATCPQATSIADNKGRTPLHYATYRRSLRIIRLILDAHPSAATAADKLGETPLGIFFKRLNADLRRKLDFLLDDDEGSSIAPIEGHESERLEKVREVHDTTVLFLQAATHGTIGAYQNTFQILRAAITTPQCPWSFFNMLLRIDNKQEHLYDDEGNALIHIAAGTESSFDGELHKCGKCRCKFNNSSWYQDKIDWRLYCEKCCSKKKLDEKEYIVIDSVNKIPAIIKDLTAANSKLASIPDHDGRLPLSISIFRDKSFEEGGVKTIFHAAPKALSTRDIGAHMYPFMMAAVERSRETNVLEKFTTCYMLLAMNPVLVSIGIPQVWHSKAALDITLSRSEEADSNDEDNISCICVSEDEKALAFSLASMRSTLLLNYTASLPDYIQCKKSPNLMPPKDCRFSSDKHIECKEVGGYTRRCSEVSGYTQQCSEVSRYSRRWSEVSGYARRLSGISGYTRQCSEISGDTRQCSQISGDIRQCSEVSGYTQQCSQMNSCTVLNCIDTGERFCLIEENEEDVAQINSSQRRKFFKSNFLLIFALVTFLVGSVILTAVFITRDRQYDKSTLTGITNAPTALPTIKTTRDPTPDTDADSENESLTPQVISPFLTYTTTILTESSFLLSSRSSVSVSYDGTRIAVGTNAGVLIYNYNGTWHQSDTIQTNDELSHISLSADGNRLAVGFGNYYLRVYQFNNQSETMQNIRMDHIGLRDRIRSRSQNWRVMGNDFNFDQNSVDTSLTLSSNGKRIAVAATQNGGQVHILEYNSTHWNIEQTLNGNTSDYGFGKSISFSEDGTYLAIGSWLSDSYGLESGHVTIYKYNQSFTTVGKIIGSMDHDRSGSSLSFSADGKTLAIGSWQSYNDQIRNGGQCRIFGFNNTWEKIGSSLDNSKENEYFGCNVVLSGNGQRLLVASKGKKQGIVRLYNRLNGEWSEVLEEVGEVGFGEGMGLSYDGYRVVVVERSGKVYIYDYSE